MVAFVWNCLAWPRNMMWIISTTDSGVRCLTAAMFWLRAPPAMLMKVIEDCAAVMDVILSPVPMETTVTMMPDSEEYQFTLGYLLAWQLLLRLFHSAGSKVQVCVSLVESDNWVRGGKNQRMPCWFRGRNRLMSWCLMSSDVIWHIRDKLWPMPKHGSIKSTYVRCMRV